MMDMLCEFPHFWMYDMKFVKQMGEYIDMKVSKSAINMISVLADSKSRKNVVENSLSLYVHKCCQEITLKTLVDMQQFLIFI